MKNIYSKISEIPKEVHPLVLATVISTRGSTPQKAGSSAIFSRHGLVDGTIGGGVLEGQVQKLAMEASITGHSGIYNFELDNSIDHKTEAICGGQVSVLIESGIEKYSSMFNLASQSLISRQPCVMAALITKSGGNPPKITRMILSEEMISSLQDELVDIIRPALKRLLAVSSDENFLLIEAGKSGTEERKSILLESLFPLPRLIIAGAGHIGKALSHLGRMLEFEVTLIDDRAEYANPGNLPEAHHIIVKNPGQAIVETKPGSDTFVVIVTRGHSDDAGALKGCIASDARYIGMIGSKVKIEKMRRNFIENRWATEEQWNKIHAPVGLEIKSQTVEEIAVSIAAELVLVRNSVKK